MNKQPTLLALSAITYAYKVSEGTLPAAGAATPLFIDWIGVGGYPGVGVGLRGPGVY